MMTVMCSCSVPSNTAYNHPVLKQTKVASLHTPISLTHLDSSSPIPSMKCVGWAKLDS